jgi:hypothetical protein
VKQNLTTADFTDKHVLVKLGLEDILSRGTQPTRLAAYELIKRAVPNFSWRVAWWRGDKPVVQFRNYPTINGRRPSLRHLVAHAMGIECLNFDPAGFDLSWEPLFKLGEPGVEFGLMLQRLCYTPPAVVVQTIAKWLETALTGVESVIFSPTCPAWTVDPQTQRYTFDGLDDGVGLVASRVLAALPEFSRFCQAHGLNVRFIVAIGDFEATEQSCTKLGISRAEFLARLQRSQDAFRLAASEIPSLETPFITALDDNWSLIQANAASAVNKNNFSGPLRWSGRKLLEIAQARLSLYIRWYGKSVDAVGLTLAQGADYAAIGRMVSNRLPNPLVLAGDQVAMGAFWQTLQSTPLPVAYLRGNKY